MREIFTKKEEVRKFALLCANIRVSSMPFISSGDVVELAKEFELYLNGEN